MSKIVDMAGHKIGRLTVIRFSHIHLNRQAMWICECDCGVKTVVAGGWLRSGNTKSCGCLVRDMASKRNKTHGMYGMPEHNSWHAMHQRCSYPSHVSARNYQERGITVCERWKEFSNFYADMGKKPTPKHTIERINNDLGYFKENCKWATRKEQRANRRDSIRAIHQ